MAFGDCHETSLVRHW